MRRLGITTALGLAAAALSTPAHALPVAPDKFCETYPDTPSCTGGLDCRYCHDSYEGSNITWNAYGEDVRSALGGVDPSEFISQLPLALAAVEGLDSDGDGWDNLSEIEVGALPGNPDSMPGSAECPADVSDLDYPICQYSPRHVFRKVRLDFCGVSPSYDELEAFLALDDAAQMAAIDAALDTCLDSEFWLGKDGVLWQLAHPKVRPVGALKAGEDEYTNVTIADYYNDYNLYVWSQIDDHDARSVLTADFFVTRDTMPSTTYSVVSDWSGDPNCSGACDEPMQQDRRAGMITSRWFLSYFVMFTPLPRSAAAQAYRAFLGVDIAKNEGMFPITIANGYPEDEPKDYDAKGVTAPACAACHSTLDPLTYAYRNYNGLTGTNGAGRAKYVPGRLELIWDDPLMNQTPESGYIFGQPYQDLVEWAQIAANSDQFAVAAVSDYWRMLIGRDPVPAEADEFDQLWTDLKTTHGYSVEKMLHDFVRTEAYGAP